MNHDIDFLRFLKEKPSLLGIDSFHDLHKFLSGFQIAILIMNDVHVQEVIRDEVCIKRGLHISNRPWYFAVYENNGEDLQRTLLDVSDILREFFRLINER